MRPRMPQCELDGYDREVKALFDPTWGTEKTEHGCSESLQAAA
jgi:hypothetical protein